MKRYARQVIRNATNANSCVPRAVPRGAETSDEVTFNNKIQSAPDDIRLFYCTYWKFQQQTQQFRVIFIFSRMKGKNGQCRSFKRIWVGQLCNRFRVIYGSKILGCKLIK